MPKGKKSNAKPSTAESEDDFSSRVAALCRKLKIEAPGPGEIAAVTFARIGIAYASKQPEFQTGRKRRGRRKGSVTKSKLHEGALKMIKDLRRALPNEKPTKIEKLVFNFLEEKGALSIPDDGADTLRAFRKRIRRLEESVHQKAVEKVAKAMVKRNLVH
jgi:hypothetical protein